VAPAGFVLNIAGLARSQLAVSQFILRLEQTGLFDRVSLIDTARETFLGGPATGFKLECSLTGTAAGAPAHGLVAGQHDDDLSVNPRSGEDASARRDDGPAAGDAGGAGGSPGPDAGRARP
jgi:hypothetical protein